MNEPRASGPARRSVLVARLAAGPLLTVTVPFTALYFLSTDASGHGRGPPSAEPDRMAARRDRVRVHRDEHAAPVPTSRDVAGGHSEPRGESWMWLSGWAGVAWFLGFFALMVVFPNGRLPDGRWRGREPAPAGARRRPGRAHGRPRRPSAHRRGRRADRSRSPTRSRSCLTCRCGPAWPRRANCGALRLVALLVVGVASIIVRYRRSTGILRLQLRWLSRPVVVPGGRDPHRIRVCRALRRRRAAGSAGRSHS